VRVSTAFNKMLMIPGAWVFSVSFTEQGLVVGIRRRFRRLTCPCGASTRAAYDRSLRRWRHIDVAGMRVYLEAEIRRVSCRACRRVRTEAVPWARPGARHTRDFEDLCAWLCQRTDRTSASRLLRCSWEAVSAIVRRVVADAVDTSRLRGLYRIGVDEISYRRRTFLTLVVDHDSGNVVWIGEGKRAETLRAFFDELGPEGTAAVEAVSLDDGRAFVTATMQAAPQAQICLDPFHVVRLANDAVEATRRHVLRTSRRRPHGGGPGSRQMRWALRKGADALSPSQRTVLDELRKQRHVLWRAWVLKEELRDLYRIEDPTAAASYMRTWLSRAARSRIPQMVDLARRLRSNFAAIVAAVELGLSNSRLEGTNSKIRLINHRGFGHHSAAALMAMIHLCCGGLQIALPFH
jgi:transposase